MGREGKKVFVHVHVYLPVLCTKTLVYPFYFQFVNSRIACVVEESIVDPIARTFTTYTRNITYKMLMVVEEKCVYTVHPQNREW